MINLTINYAKRKIGICFPCAESVLSEALGRIGASGNKTEQFMVEIKAPAELKVLDSKFLNLDELNYLAKRMDSFIKEELDKFYEVVKLENYESPKDMINLTFNMNGYTLIQDMRDIEAVGRKHYLTEQICASVSEMEKADFKKIGRELLKSDKGKLTERGLLFKNDGIMQKEVYDGKVFPQYSFSGSELLCAAIVYGGKNEFVYLPDNPIAITKAISRLGAPNAESCSFSLEYLNYESEKWHKKFEKMLCEEDIFKINILAEEVNSVDKDFDKLDAVIKYALYKEPELSESIEVITKLAKHIDDFNIIDKVDDFTEVGQKVIEMSEEYSLSIELEDYFDFEAFGSDFSESNGGEFIDGNFIYMEEYASLEDILSEELHLKFGGI